MYIKTIIIKNYKCYGEKPSIIDFKTPDAKTPGSGLNILVGKNNSGKSSLFESVDFLRDGVPKGKNLKDLINIKMKEEDEMSVELIFCGDITSVIESFAQENKVKVLKKYIFTQDGKEHLKIARTSKNEKAILVWNEKDSVYTNESGIDAPIKRLFEADFIWADSNPSAEAKFGATTICGKLLKEISKSFIQAPEYGIFQSAFKKAFNDDDSTLRKSLVQIEKRTQQIFESQFGTAKISFHFEELEIDSFFKNTKIKIDDGQETFLEDKGSGMQRILALTLLQVYAENLVKHPENGSQKPFYLFIDEPEVCLHPQAQRKLLSALKEISKNNQVFINTHSSYFVEPSLIENIYKFHNDNKDITTFFLKDMTLKQELKENRNFFFHHRDIFFADYVIFLEGADDIERYTKFCNKNGFDNLPQYFFLMSGCTQTLFYEKICMEFGINNFLALVDNDFGYNVPFWKRNSGKQCLVRVDDFAKENKFSWFQTDKMNDAIEKIDGVTPKNGNDYQLVDIDVNGIKIKKTAIHNILVLQKGEVKDYLNNDGTIRDNDSDKNKELSAIFCYVSNSFI